MCGAGTRARSIQILPARTVDQVKYSGARIELTASLPVLMRAVYAIESSKPYLFVVAGRGVGKRGRGVSGVAD